MLIVLTADLATQNNNSAINKKTQNNKVAHYTVSRSGTISNLYKKVMFFSAILFKA